MKTVIVRIMKIWPKRWVATALVVLAILYLTLVPRPLPDNDIDIPGLDKVVHALMFGGLAFVGCIDMARRGSNSYVRLPRRDIRIAVLAVSLFGGAVEIVQEAMSAGRSGDAFDFMADAAGAAVGAISAAYVLKLWLKQNHGPSC